MSQQVTDPNDPRASPSPTSDEGAISGDENKQDKIPDSESDSDAGTSRGTNAARATTSPTPMGKPTEDHASDNESGDKPTLGKRTWGQGMDSQPVDDPVRPLRRSKRTWGQDMDSQPVDDPVRPLRQTFQNAVNQIMHSQPVNDPLPPLRQTFQNAVNQIMDSQPVDDAVPPPRTTTAPPTTVGTLEPVLMPQRLLQNIIKRFGSIPGFNERLWSDPEDSRNPLLMTPEEFKAEAAKEAITFNSPRRDSNSPRSAFIKTLQVVVDGTFTDVYSVVTPLEGGGRALKCYCSINNSALIASLELLTAPAADGQASSGGGAAGTSPAAGARLQPLPPVPRYYQTEQESDSLLAPRPRAQGAALFQAFRDSKLAPSGTPGARPQFNRFKRHQWVASGGEALGGSGGEALGGEFQLPKFKSPLNVDVEGGAGERIRGNQSVAQNEQIRVLQQQVAELQNQVTEYKKESIELNNIKGDPHLAPLLEFKKGDYGLEFPTEFVTLTQVLVQVNVQPTNEGQKKRGKSETWATPLLLANLKKKNEGRPPTQGCKPSATKKSRRDEDDDESDDGGRTLFSGKMRR